MSDTDRTDEARAAYLRLVAARGQAETGQAPWSILGEFFTADAVFIDPAWGRFEGLAAITRFLDESMAGLEGWSFPEQWTIVEGDRVVSFWWNRLPGARPDGRPLEAPGVSILRYAGQGKFDYELDLLNMAEVRELMEASEWRPNASLNPPPAQPDRNATPPG